MLFAPTAGFKVAFLFFVVGGLVDFTNQVGVGTIATVMGLFGMIWAIRSYMSGAQRDLIETWQERAKLASEEAAKAATKNAESAVLIADLQRSRDWTPVAAKIDQLIEMQGHDSDKHQAILETLQGILSHMESRDVS